MIETMKRFLGRLGDDAGSSVVFAALGIVVIIGFAAVAVDLGMLYSAESEAQRAADAGARAGAYELISHPNDAQQAEDTAIYVSSRNVVRGDQADVWPEDVIVDLDERTVRVIVRRSSDRENAFNGFFAGIFGFNELGVAVDATAKVVAATSGKCLLPTAIPDLWAEDVDGDGTPDRMAEPGDTYDSDTGDCYDCAANTSGGYQVGDQVTLYPGQGAESSFEPGWWNLWNPAQDEGASHMKDWVTSCPDGDAVWGPGDDITDKNGSNTSIVNEFDKLIDMDPNAESNFDGENVTIQNSDYGGTSSPRVRPIVLFNPDTYQKVGNDANFEITDVAGVFVEGVTGNEVNATFMNFPGLVPAADPDADSFAKMIRLIE